MKFKVQYKYHTHPQCYSMEVHASNQNILFAGLKKLSDIFIIRIKVLK